MEPVASYYKFNETGAFSVDWYIGKRCNFNCSYCVDYLHDYTSPHMPLSNMKYLVDILTKKHNDNILWSLSGGEPTIHPQFLDLCLYIKQSGSKYLSVTTNGSRTLDYHKQMYQSVDGITMSFHFEFLHKRIDEYIKKCIALDDYRIELNTQGANPKKTLILRFMVETGELDNIKRMEKAFRDHGITNIEHRYIRKPSENKGKGMQPTEKFEFKDDKDPNQITNKKQISKIENNERNFYEKEELDELKLIYKSTVSEDKRKLKFWFKKDNGTYIDEDFHYNELNFDRKSNFQNWLCWAGLKHIKITPTGDVYIGSCHVGGLRGNLFNVDDIDLPIEPIICNKWRCTDNTDLKVPKIKNMEHYHLIKPMIEYEKNKNNK